jgi:hypothetical protein
MFMNIEVGDIVRLEENGKLKLAWIEVLELRGEDALCRYYIVDKNVKGSERPEFLIPTDEYFPLTSLSLVKKNN